MTRAYELTFIVRPDPDEKVIQDAISQVKGWVEANDQGTVTKIDQWGRRRLAFELAGQREGYYVLMEADIDPSNLEELELNLKLSNSILRYLLIRPD
jgi:small subunit ribosomal protein S6